MKKENKPTLTETVEEAVGTKNVNTMKARQLILNERDRQINKEGWSIEHDDSHIHGELAKAADCYFEYADENDYTDNKVHHCWPWDKNWWKPKNQLSDYTRAGALYLAELQRLERLGGEVGPSLTNLRIGIRQCEIRIDEVRLEQASQPGMVSKEALLAISQKYNRGYSHSSDRILQDIDDLLGINPPSK